jgi:tetratricopeptide (TPR) repeat protein
MSKRVWLVCALAAVMTANHVQADGVADGNAGMEALKNQDYDKAIRMFTRALLVGKLSQDDSEFAYFNRGNAYAGAGDLDKAVADYQKAIQIKPDDDDAQSALQAALDKKSGATGSASAVGGDPWGLMSFMVGKLYWYQPLGKPPHEAYLKVSWVTEQRDLSLSVRSKTGQPLVSEYKIDNNTGKIIYSALVYDAPEYGTIKATPTTFTETTFVNGSPVRFVTKAQTDGSLLQTKQVFLGGGWQDTTTVQLVETTADELAAAGLMKIKRKKN